MKIHQKYITRCIEIAKNGLGTTAPNPMVGCVIVRNNKIIGEGFTSPYGGNHAEVNAITSVTNKSQLNEATLYVTLEPCSHFGKTPPCSNLIIEHGIPNVVIGCVDDNQKVAGKGIAKLIESGCNVTVGVLEEECKHHHKRFFTFHNKRRPFIFLKWAETSDGFIAPLTKDEQKPVWITNKYARQLVHKWRSEEQAILVGANTVLVDNPSLTTRHWKGNNPIRIILDKHNSLSRDFNIFNDEAETLVFTGNDIDYHDAPAKEICKLLYEKNINSVIIEGGSKTMQLFIKEGLWDEARVFIGKSSFDVGVRAPELKSKQLLEQNITGDILKIYTND